MVEQVIVLTREDILQHIGGLIPAPGIPIIILAGANTPTPSFIAPPVTQDTLLAFNLVVTDNSGVTSAKPVTVYVLVKHIYNNGQGNVIMSHSSNNNNNYNHNHKYNNISLGHNSNLCKINYCHLSLHINNNPTICSFITFPQSIEPTLVSRRIFPRLLISQ